MNIIHKYCLLLAVICALQWLMPAPLEAADYGLVINQTLGADNKGSGDEDAQVDYQAIILPSFSSLIGDNGEFSISAGMTLGYEEDFSYVFELLRTEFSMRFGNAGIKAGRISYSDPLSFIANGLFDGAQFYHNSAMGSFNAGAWYTGLLYKKNANITMTPIDQAKYDSELDNGDFYDTYFAPPRLLAALGWEHPSLGEFMRLKTAVIGQFDVNDEDYKYHSQYIILKAGVPVKNLLIELGGSVAIAEAVLDDENEINTAFAGDIGFFYTLPTSFLSRLSFTTTIGGGKLDDNIGAFIPITTKTYGDILEAKMSGLTALGLNYTARVNSAIGTSLSVSHFVRNDLGTYRGYPLSFDSGDGYSLGTEFFARFIWSPVSDLQFNLGGGVFAPALGNADKDADPQWRIALTAILSI